MKRRPPPVDLSGELPPPELVRFKPSSRPWPPEEFAAWLRVRMAWRDTHAEPLPPLWSLDRVALHRLDLPPALVEAELAAPVLTPPGHDPRRVLSKPYNDAWEADLRGDAS